MLMGNFQEVSVGVPQGSVLGACLYVPFVNDLPEVVHGHGPAQGAQVGNQTVFNIYCAKCGGVCCAAMWMTPHTLTQVLAP